VIFVDIAIITTIITVRRIYPSFKRLTLLFIFLSLLVGLSPWIIVLYSDTLLMPFISLLVLLCLLIVQAKSTTRRVVYASVSGVLFAVGWLIKPTVIVIAAALAVFGVIYLFQVRGKINLKQSAAVLLTGVFALILTLNAFDLYVEKQNIIRVDKTIRTPATYTIATGLMLQPVDSNRFHYGTYSTRVTSLNHGTTEEKNERFISLIKEELCEFGAVGYMTFLFNKARWITSEGYFNWLGEGGGTADFSNPERNILKSLLYPNSRYYPIYMNAANGLWIVVFFGICLAVFIQIFTGFRIDKLRSNFGLFMQLIAFFSIFVLLFTEGRSRYLLSFLPVFCMVSVSGYSHIKKVMNSCRKSTKTVL
jgi:4-amino-4-deoxy-L-arabinose transferase-like glycosyltransferase